MGVKMVLGFREESDVTEMRPPRHRLPTFRIHGVRHLGVQREEIGRRKVETIEI